MIFDVIMMTVGLSMDSLVVSIVGGASIKRCRVWRHVLKIALTMGVFQGGLTLAGYLFGIGFERYVYAFDHWVAFGLLAYLGGRMIYGELFKKEEHVIDLLNNRTLVYMALATSIDAIAVGISLAVLKNPIVWQAVIIGGGTFAAVACGVYFGYRFGKKAKVKLVGIAGGIILICTGVKILLEHLLSL
jgi:putative Mn2+ efflux pump MntP